MTESARRRNLRAAERLDVLEDDLPRGICAVKGCQRSGGTDGHGLYAWAGTWGTHYLCSRHRPRYREHDRILRAIRNIPPRSAIYLPRSDRAG